MTHPVEHRNEPGSFLSGRLLKKDSPELSSIGFRMDVVQLFCYGYDDLTKTDHELFI
jgi:hypothetical protein